MSGVPIGPDRTKCCRDGGTMTRFFGEPWDAPMVDDGNQVPTPVGEPCLHCGQAIVDGDQGFIMSVQSADGMAVVSQPAHWHCWLILARRSTFATGDDTVNNPLRVPPEPRKIWRPDNSAQFHIDWNGKRWTLTTSSAHLWILIGPEGASQPIGAMTVGEAQARAEIWLDMRDLLNKATQEHRGWRPGHIPEYGPPLADGGHQDTGE